jgi:SAM-dependent methyltransferase
MDRELSRCIKKYCSGRLLDIGCAEKPYHRFLGDNVTSHIGIDHYQTLHNKSKIDIFSTAYAIPIQGDTFDSALCTAVLEHLEEPEMAIRECARVLKPGGTAIYTVPFIWHLHEEPRDFYRYSKFGLEYLFKKAGFEIVEIKALSGFWVTFGQLFVYNIYRLNLGPLRWLHIIDLLGLLIQGISFILDKIDKSEQWTWMYLVVVRKK